MLRTQYTGNNNEVIFFRNDVAINWSGISSDTPVGEGGSGGNCPSQNLVDMYDMAGGSSPFKQYDATGALCMLPARSLRPSMPRAAITAPTCGQTATRAFQPLFSIRAHLGELCATTAQSACAPVWPTILRATPTPPLPDIICASISRHNPQLQPWRLGLSPLDNHPLCRDSYELCRGSK